MKINYLRKKIKKIKKELPGNRYEKQTFIEIHLYQLFSILLSPIAIALSYYISKYFLFLIIFLYPILEAGIIAVPMVLQLPGEPNRYNAPTAVLLWYCIFFIGMSVFILLASMLGYNYVLAGIFIFYTISIIRIIKTFMNHL